MDGEAEGTEAGEAIAEELARLVSSIVGPNLVESAMRARALTEIAEALHTDALLALVVQVLTQQDNAPSL